MKSSALGVQTGLSGQAALGFASVAESKFELHLQ